MLATSKLESALREILTMIKEKPRVFWMRCYETVQAFYFKCKSMEFMYDNLDISSEPSEILDCLLDFKPTSTRCDEYARLVKELSDQYHTFCKSNPPTNDFKEEYMECDKSLTAMGRMTHFQVSV